MDGVEVTKVPDVVTEVSGLGVTRPNKTNMSAAVSNHLGGSSSRAGPSTKPRSSLQTDTSIALEYDVVAEYRKQLLNEEVRTSLHPTRPILIFNPHHLAPPLAETM